MFRKRLVAVSILAFAVSGIAGSVPTASAQEVIDLDEEPAPTKKKAKAKKGGVDIDLDEGAPAAQGPVVAGNMTESAAQAKQLFDKERWSEAAQALHRVVTGETGDDPGNKQLAEYYLAIALYRLKFYQASYAIFSVVADNPNHLKFKETLLWLAKLATQLPEPADIIERVGKYNDEQVARFDNPQQRDLPPGDTAGDTGAAGEPEPAELDLPGPDDPVAWSYVEPGTEVIGREGVRIGSVKAMLGTEAEGIFHGIALDPAGGGDPRVIPADSVTSLTTSRVQVQVATDQVNELEAYQGDA